MHSASAAHKPTLGPFSLISRIRKPSINPGEAIEIEVFITGTGNSPTDIKLNLSNPASILKVDKEGNVGYTETSIIIQKDKDNKITGIAMGNDEIIFTKAGELVPVIRKSPIYLTGSSFSLTEGYFQSAQFYNELKNIKIDKSDKRILGELTWGDGQPPIFIKLNTSNDAPPGNHKIVLSLYYSDEFTSNIDENEVVIHINNWIERYEKHIKYFALIVGVAGIIQTIFTVLQYFKPIS